MKTILRCLFAVVIALGAQQALADRVNGCPAGQAMQSSDASGRSITCIPIGGGEADIIGQWAVTGTTECLQSSTGFDPTTFSPIFSSAGQTILSQLAGTFIGTRTFYAGGAGRSVGTSQTMTFAGSASVTTVDIPFTWAIQNDGRLLIDDDNTIAQLFTAPPSRLGFTATIANFPSFIGYISKDKRTILLTHAGHSVETSVVRNADNVVTSTNPRFCARTRILIRLP